MILQATTIPGCFVIELRPRHDERGFFARSFCREEFEQHGLNPDIALCGVSSNPKRGTLRGMHYQIAPHAECKLVRCTSGAAFDVALDLRDHSPTFGRWHAVVLTAGNHRMHFIPEGVAHGFLTLEDHTELHYQISSMHHPASARGVRWNDPAFAIDWPIKPMIISARDKAFPLFADKLLEQGNS